MKERSLSGDSILAQPQLGHKNIWRWLGNVFFDWSVILMAYVFVFSFQTWWAALFAIAVIGTRQHALGILSHDGAHWLITNNLKLNDFLTRVLASWPIFLPLGKYREYHFRHHRFLGTERDPELESKFLEAPAWDLPISPVRLFGIILSDLTGIGIVWYKRRTILRFFGKKYVYGALDTKTEDTLSGQGSKDVPLESHMFLYWGLILGVFWYAGMLWVLGIWIFSLLTSCFAVFRLRVWTEHVGTPGTHRFYATVWQRALFLPHHTWYHFEHHLLPSVPFGNLPLVRAHVIPDIPVITLGKVFDYFYHSTFIPTGKALKKSSEGQE